MISKTFREMTEYFRVQAGEEGRNRAFKSREVMYKMGKESDA